MHYRRSLCWNVLCVYADVLTCMRVVINIIVVEYETYSLLNKFTMHWLEFLATQWEDQLLKPPNKDH